MTTEHETVVHLVPTPYRGTVDRRKAGAGIVGGLVIVGGAVLRVINGGQSELSFFGALLAAVVVVAVVVLYGYMRFKNATVFVSGSDIGITNAFRIRKKLDSSEVVSLRKTVELEYGRSVGVLLIVTRDPKRVLRFKGGDRLQPGGIDRIAGEIAVPVEGSW
jgi:hypothetical protein